MSDALTPIEQKTVLFYEDEITAVITEKDGRRQVYIPVRPICDRLGLDWSAQLQRLRRDMILSKEMSGVVVTPTPLSKFANPQDMICIPLEFLQGWLFGVNASRVKEEIRPTLLQYQRECYRVLYEATQEGRLSTTPDVDFDDLLAQASTDTADAYRLAVAIVKLARNQVIIEAQIGQHGRTLADHAERLETIEASLNNPDRHITKEQAARISQAVRAIGHVMSERSGRSEYGSIYGEFYRRFETPSYAALPANKYEDAIRWLNAWYQRLTNQDIPF